MSKFAKVERVKELLRYDKETGKLHWTQPGVTQRPVGAEAGCICKDGYIRTTIDAKKYANHRLAFVLMNDKWPDEFVDHVNGDRADNRWENLRPCSPAQNSFNAKLSSRNTTGVKGVNICGRTGKFVVDICGKKLGSFKDLELAELVVKEYRDTLHGSFANHG